VHRAVATGTFGPGSELARRHLEWQPSRLPGIAGPGSKGGSLTGVLTDAFELRRPDGTVATADLLVRRMSVPDHARALAELPEQRMLVGALTDPGAWAGLRCAVDPAG
jgi:hypothetical protein